MPSGFAGYGQADTAAKALGNLSLEDLLNVKVVSVSKKAELLFDAPLSASVIATQDSVVLMMTRLDFDRLVEQHHAIGVKLLRRIAVTISLRLRKTTGRLADLLAAR